MEVCTRYFTKLRNLAVFLETETADLQQAHKNPDCGGTEGAVKILQDLRTEVWELKTQVQDQLACCKAEDKEIRTFMQACLVLKQRTTEDLQKIRRHYEKYGYRAPSEVKSHKEKAKVQEANQEGRGEEDEQQVEEEEKEEEGGEAESKEEQCHTVPGHRGLSPVLVTPEKPSSRVADPLRTPRLSDFGLSELHLLVPLGDPAPPSMVFAPPTAPDLPVLPRMPKTPKCALRMEEEAVTPRLEDFGISEHTMCLNNDFTMDLLRKIPSTSSSEGPVNTAPVLRPAPSSVPSFVTCEPEAIGVTTPQLPVLCTPGLKVLKKHSQLSSPSDSCGSPPPALHLTPEPPACETPHVKKLLSSTDGPGVREPMPCNRPESSFSLKQTLLPVLGGYHELQSQELTLSPPQVLTSLAPHPKTPEMPDISASTQDIFKLLSQCNREPSAGPTACLKAEALRSPTVTAAGDKENRVQLLALVSEEEFRGLPSYLRQMPLSSLNQAISRINTSLEGCPQVDATTAPGHFLTEELKRITGTGLKAHVYFLCLTELQRLEHVQGEGEYRVFSQV